MAGGSKAAQQAFRLKGTAPAVTMLVLQTVDAAAIERQLAEHVAQMPQFFQHAPVMLDVEALRGVPVDFAEIASLLRRHRLVPVAVRNLDEAHREAAVAAGWGVLQAALVRSSPAAAASSPAPAADVLPSKAPCSLMVRQPVRSGQVVYAAQGDLVVLAAVSSGAELVAAGNIHVYAPLRGRALAGVHDNPEASVFSTCLDAEFLSVAGRPLTSEEIPESCRGRPARAYLEEGRVVVTEL